MATRIDNSVTLTHDEADQVARLLNELADDHRNQARRTKSANTRSFCLARAELATDLAYGITRKLFTWT
jgi:hypothetical protein